MQQEAINKSTLHRAFAPTATPIAHSFALVAFFFTCGGCTVRDEQPTNQRRVEVKVNVDLNRRPPCPDGFCPKQAEGETKAEGETRRGGEGENSSSPPLPLTLSPTLDPEKPVMNLPLEARCRNYGGVSCVCASTISLLRWQCRDELAAALRTVCVGGQSAGSLHAHLEHLGVRYAFTTSGDVTFLEWAIRTRRGCGITYYPAHYVNLVDLTDDHATLLDNNRVVQYLTVPRDEFIRQWRSYGGWATAVVYAPAAPIARR